MAADITKNNKHITIAEVESFLATAKNCIEELLRAARQLPKVDEDGSSECPFAEELYAKKEEAQKKAQECLEQLNEYQDWVEQELTRCQSNLSVVSSGKSALHTDRAIGRLSDAEERLVALCEKLEELLEKIQKIFRHLQESLKEAFSKQFPGRIPRKYPGFGAPVSYSKENMASDFKNSGLDNEIKQLIAKGACR